VFVVLKGNPKNIHIGLTLPGLVSLSSRPTQKPAATASGVSLLRLVRFLYGEVTKHMPKSL
jgi:hypothetical protein